MFGSRTAVFILCMIPWSYALLLRWGKHGCEGASTTWIYNDETHILIFLACAGTSYVNIACAKIMAAEHATRSGQGVLDYRRVKFLSALKLGLCYMWVFAFVLNPRHGLLSLHAAAYLLGACTVEGVLVVLVMLVKDGTPTEQYVRVLWSGSVSVGVCYSLLVAAMSAAHVENCYANTTYK